MQSLRTTFGVHLMRLIITAFALPGILLPRAVSSQTLSPSLFNGLAWRLVGPFRAGRVVAVSGVPGSDGSFFFGGVDGGVWKTTDAGTVWQPLFDKQPVASIGALAVAQSDPRVIYAGTGESDIRSDLASGNGVYRSDDSGATWKHMGLDEWRQISRILVDPSDARTVYVGVLGHAYGPSPERGVYKSTDGGEHWQHVLDKGPETGIADVALAISKPQVLFAATWNAHRSTWSTYAPIEGPGSGIYRSIDGGAHWIEVSGHGLPGGKWGRTGIAVSADGRRVYATIASPDHPGLYRSDDGGDTWTLANSDPRLTSRAWYFSSLTIDPTNADVLYIPNVALFRTEDGGKTIEIVRGAPGGDDYHQVWVDPRNSEHLMLGVDQGATVSLDRGRTWTTWYNQPTAQLYHVTTDHRFPYNIYGAQQDSGSIAVASRSDHGHVDTRDWFLPGGSESGYIAIDPLDENIIYETGTFGTVQRFDRRTSFSQTITPWPLGGFDLPINKRRYRDPWTPVLAFSPADKRSLYLGTQYVMRTKDGGLHWEQISPDLTGTQANTDDHAPLTNENAVQRGYGVVYSIAPSPLNADEIWAGTDTGRIHLTRDGGQHWADVTPAALAHWSKIALIEASHAAPGTAYAAVDRHRLDDQKPYLYITRDYGKTWTLSVEGIASNHFINAVREDTEQPDLLFAGTEFGIYASFDQGKHWQPLQLNLPVTSIRDMNINGSDLVVATHGRSFWVLDNIAPLRHAAEAQKQMVYLYPSPIVVRVDNDGFLGTPMPPEEPQANNPPNGAAIDYYLQGKAQKITLQILDSQGRVLRHFSSADKPSAEHPLLPIAERWFPRPQLLDTSAGHHRFVWDLAAGGSGTGLGDDDDEDTAGVPPGPRVPPGTYTVRLLVDNSTSESKLQVVMDPRAAATPEILAQQFTLADSIYAKTLTSRKAMAEVDGVQSQLSRLGGETDNTPPALTQALQEALAALHSIRDGNPGAQDGDSSTPGLAAANAGLGVALRIVESGDRPAPAQAITIFDEMSAAAQKRIEAWQHCKSTELARVNAELMRAHRPPLQVAAVEAEVHYSMTR